MCRVFCRKQSFSQLFFIFPGATLFWLYYLYFLIISQIHPYLSSLPLPQWISQPDYLTHHLVPPDHSCTPLHPPLPLPMGPAHCKKSDDNEEQSRFYQHGSSESLNCLQRSKITPSVSKSASISHATNRSEDRYFSRKQSALWTRHL